MHTNNAISRPVYKYEPFIQYLLRQHFVPNKSPLFIY